MTIRDGSVGGTPQGTACDGGHFHGAAVHNHGDLTMESVTIAGSLGATDNGGAIATGTCSGSFNSPSPCPIGRGACATLINVTITGNAAAVRGGGIFTSQALSLTKITIAGNTAQEGFGIYSDCHRSGDRRAGRWPGRARRAQGAGHGRLDAAAVRRHR